MSCNYEKITFKCDCGCNKHNSYILEWCRSTDVVSLFIRKHIEDNGDIELILQTTDSGMVELIKLLTGKKSEEVTQEELKKLKKL